MRTLSTCGRRHVRQREYIEVYRAILNEGHRPTLALVAERLGVTRQTVWQMEQHSAFRAGLVGSLRRDEPCQWHQWAGNTDVMLANAEVV